MIKSFKGVNHGAYKRNAERIGNIKRLFTKEKRTEKAQETQVDQKTLQKCFGLKLIKKGMMNVEIGSECEK